MTSVHLIIHDLERLIINFVYYFEQLEERFHDTLVDILVIFPDLVKFNMTNVKNLVKSIYAHHRKGVLEINEKIKFELSRVISTGYWTKLGYHLSQHYHHTLCDENMPHNHQLIDKQMFFEVKDLLSSYIDEFRYINTVFYKIIL